MSPLQRACHAPNEEKKLSHRDIVAKDLEKLKKMLVKGLSSEVQYQRASKPTPDRIREKIWVDKTNAVAATPLFIKMLSEDTPKWWFKKMRKRLEEANCAYVRELPGLQDVLRRSH